ncbi:DUF3426 domain-containing protein [Janthinobacterium psychrotolerans]|uniref:MJ0042 family finger-like domain-containing protein n=1 Tax=Janthinobacterium psychrotolerans TaxID=1747903 RepID=A0A1A7BXL6_9BURK|nr:DUF3426 domain-containing protein [Janthinobacterium psychrotolerans]OBV37489.1 MJ0042 family finger-like domain-containing protein [Janthinobacterium psychrotolerans]
MALATKCPHCNTIFRVAADQLKLRGGIVRCGTCKEVFDGNAALVDPSAALLPSPHPVPAPAAVTAPLPASPSLPPVLALDIPEDSPPDVSDDTEPVYTLDFDTSFDPFGILPETAQLKAGEDKARDSEEAIELDLDIGQAPEPAAEPASEAEPGPLPAPVMAVPPAPMAPFRRRETDEPPAFVTYLRDSRREPKFQAEASAQETDNAPYQVNLDKPARPAAASARQEPTLSDHSFDLPAGSEPPAAELHVLDDLPPVEEPAFVTQGRRREQSGKALRVAMLAGAIALLMLLLLQVMTTFRNPLAAQFPQFKPVLSALCSVSGCQVDLPAQIEALAIEQGELQTLAPNRFSYVSQLRNLGRSAQAWPNIELILNDDDGKPVLRRVVAPRDYLPAGTDASKGFAPRSEQNIKLYFTLDQLAASGYHIAIFYP